MFARSNTAATATAMSSCWRNTGPATARPSSSSWRATNVSYIISWCDRSAAEDVFQETFLQVHQSVEQFDPQRRFRPWLFTIAANKARDLRRSQARRPVNALQATVSPTDEESGEFIDLMQAVDNLPEKPLERAELQQLVQKAVMSMPDHLRQILLLSYFHDFPYKQISEILDIPLGTVKSRLHAAVAHFADRWKNSNRSEPTS
jgi:RNA polymerase sigma-70 factor, ECF subfamily